MLGLAFGSHRRIPLTGFLIMGSQTVSARLVRPRNVAARLNVRIETIMEQEPIRIPITDVFDLHTVQPKEVADVVEAYLEEAHRLGLRSLRIIHGRGVGVQRQIVRTELARSPFVITYRDAPPEAGGWGATIVKLGDAGAPAVPED
jgi:dsDNA-specific endonuclease/ATPase MutS2